MAESIQWERPQMSLTTIHGISLIAGVILGYLVGNALGSGLLGIAVVVVLMALMVIAHHRFVAADGKKGESAAGGPAKVTGFQWRAGVAGFFALLGLLAGGLGGLVGAGLVGLALGWLVRWLDTGRYRTGLPPYATSMQVLWHNSFRFIVGAILFYLIFPILVVIPLSFNAEDFFTFTPEMLRLAPEGYSLKHYRDFLGIGGNSEWLRALSNSLIIAPFATLLAVALGTLAAIGLTQPHVPYRRAITAILISPMIVPLIISAAGMFFFYSRPLGISAFGFQGTYLGVILAHAALGIPFVIITVTATLSGFDNSLTRAAANMGADPVTTFFKVQMPLILPGVISGGLFAFITSFDEVVVVLLVGSNAQQTLPWQMFIGLREQISPTILAVATILVVISIGLLTVVELLRRRSERLRGMSPA